MTEELKQMEARALAAERALIDAQNCMNHLGDQLNAMDAAEDEGIELFEKANESAKLDLTAARETIRKADEHDRLLAMLVMRTGESECTLSQHIDGLTAVMLAKPSEYSIRQTKAKIATLEADLATERRKRQEAEALVAQIADWLEKGAHNDR